jgi:hypothetical protein
LPERGNVPGESENDPLYKRVKDLCSIVANLLDPSQLRCGTVERIVSRITAVSAEAEADVEAAELSEIVKIVQSRVKVSKVKSSNLCGPTGPSLRI